MTSNPAADETSDATAAADAAPGPDPSADPTADPAAVLTGDRWRVTVLTEGLLRLEWSEDGVFEDRASTFAVRRRLPVPAFEASRRDGRLWLTTDHLVLDYDGEEFSPHGLSVMVRGELDRAHTSVWRFGQDLDSLGGTARTLDEADGAVPLGPGVVSRFGLAVLDDSGSFLLDAQGRPGSRRPGTRDLYVFVRGLDHRAAVRDLYAVSGSQPVLPRWALGTWWSKYHPYTAEEYAAVMDSFDDERIPLSVAVLDMDWHVVDIDPAYGSGWTGYTWNRELFPDPEEFLDDLHRRGLRVTLNVHPADGVRAHEESYRAMARALGIDPDTGVPVPFDPVDERFLRAYFEILHHPLEEQGVDFWWLDWQQGTHTRLAGVDPLWLLNIAHFHDSGRDGRRPLTFSRYAGPGSHRYPVGFSGDTVISWASLAFQPAFTATASNIGYGWWSHDIGGHFFGRRDDELAVRWAQLGVFSPILRLHSSLHPFVRKEPWTYPPAHRAAIGDLLRLRHRLVPYLHTMNARAALEDAPLVEPMYWGDPRSEEAYEVPHQFRFGTELLVAPVVSPGDPDLLLGSSPAWLPPGRWVDLFTGTRYDGGRRLRLHRPLDQVPALLPAGAVLPLAGRDGEVVGADVAPDHLDVLVAPGADGSFTLAEEPGDGTGTDPERWARTRFSWDDDAGTLTVHPVEGLVSCVPEVRGVSVTLLGVRSARGRVGEAEPTEGTAGRAGVTLELGRVARDAGASLRVLEVQARGWTETVAAVYALLDRAQISYDLKLRAHEAVAGSADPTEAAARLVGLELDHGLETALMELVLASRSAG